MKNIMNHIVFCLSLFFLISSCGKSPEKARKQLHALGIDFKTDVYEDHVEASDFVVVKLFLDAGIPPNTEDALVTAVGEKNYDMVKLLLKYGANPNSKDVFLDAIFEGDIKIVELLVNKGAEVNKIHERSIGYRTYKDLPVTYAIDNEEFEIAKLLFDKGGTLRNWKRGDQPLRDIYLTDEIKEKDYDLWLDIKY
jgi:hypothetical protein